MKSILFSFGLPLMQCILIKSFFSLIKNSCVYAGTRDVKGRLTNTSGVAPTLKTGAIRTCASEATWTKETKMTTAIVTWAAA